MRSANGDRLGLGGDTSLDTRRGVLEDEALFDGVSELLSSLQEKVRGVSRNSRRSHVRSIPPPRSPQSSTSSSILPPQERRDTHKDEWVGEGLSALEPGVVGGDGDGRALDLGASEGTVAVCRGIAGSDMRKKT